VTRRHAFLSHYSNVPLAEVVFDGTARWMDAGRDANAVRSLQMETPDEEYLHRNLLLAGQCLADDC
jgi:hypothetical protein